MVQFQHLNTKNIYTNKKQNQCTTELNIARIAKAASYQVTWNVKFKCQVWSCPVCSDDHDKHEDPNDHVYHDDCDHDDHGIHW